MGCRQSCRPCANNDEWIGEWIRVYRFRHLQPSSFEPGKAQSIPDTGALTHEIPDELRSVILDHQENDPLIQAEKMWSQPVFRVFLDKGRIESVPYPAFIDDGWILPANMPNGGEDNLRCERK